MRKIIPLLLLISGVKCFSQPRGAQFAYNDFMYGTQPIPLFDNSEIKARKITAAYMVRHPMTWKSEDWSKPNPLQNECPCSYNDTFAIYKFDDQGSLREFTFIYAKSQKVTQKYDSSGNREGVNWTLDTAQFQQIITSSKIGQDSLVNTIVFMKFSKGLDTAYISKERYDNRGYLIEVQSISNKKNNHEFFDNHNGDYDYHYFQDFDNQGRLIYFSYDKQKEYKKISYPTFGKLLETYDVTKNVVTSTQATIIQKVGVSEPALAITSGYDATVLTYLEKDSKLFKLRTKITFSEFPNIEYEEILYSYIK